MYNFWVGVSNVHQNQ